MKITKNITCKCGCNFNYEATEILMKPTRYTKCVTGNLIPADEVAVVKCPSCKYEILNYDKIDITREFMD